VEPASTFHEATERAHRSARYLAAAGALLERFEPEKSLQAIVDLAVPDLADWCYVHLTTNALPRVVALANADPEKRAAARERVRVPQALSAATAVARVLAGGPPELVQVDAAVLAQAAQNPQHFADLAALGYRSAVVAPLAGREGVLGAVTFVMAESGRSYELADLEMLVELARRTGLALDNARLLEAEQRARKHAELARDRTRRLQRLTEILSSVVEQDAAVRIMVSAGCDALGAAAGFVWLLNDDGTLELAAAEHAGKVGRLEEFRAIPRRAALPIWDVVDSGKALTFENVASMAARYPLAPNGSPFEAWALMPVNLAGRTIGAVSFSFAEERHFSDEDRELLGAMIGQASLALERSRLLDSERRALARERQLHVLAARLSSALVPEQVATIACEEVVSVLEASCGAAGVRDDQRVRILGVAGQRDDATFAELAELPLDAAVPVAEAIRRAELVWCRSEVELRARYGALEAVWTRLGVRAWGAAPFAFEGRTMGALAIAFAEERVLDEGERQFVHAAGQLAAQALERARLYEAHRASEERLRIALGAARVGTFTLDLKTLKSVRDPSYCALLGTDDDSGQGDFERMHPDDRPGARVQFERSLGEGVPYEPEVRLQRDDGSYLWVRAHGRVIRGLDGTPVSLAGVVVDIDEAKRASLEVEEQRRVNETLYRLGSSFTSELDQERLIQLITDEITKLVGAEVGAYFAREPGGAALTRLAVSPPGSEQFGSLEQMEATVLVSQAVVEHRVVRVDDAAVGPQERAGLDAASRPPELRSYLAVPVVTRSGEPFGSLLFGHSLAGRFTAKHERLAAGIAAQSAVALENARLYQTVREHKEQLEFAVERARLADRRKDEFLAMLGHELRNPLAPIVTALALMELKAPGTLPKERAVIHRQVEHLKRLVDDLLDVSRITRGKIELALQVLEVGVVLTKAIETVSPLFEQRQQHLVIHAPRSGLLVDADAMRLGQVFENLLSNAAKYSDPGAEISLSAHAVGGTIEVDVSDPGLGIAPELAPRLFDLFVQGERAIDRSQGGLGIGLAIAKSLSELHGGAIRVQSEGPGRGSTFTVTLPRAQRSKKSVEARLSVPSVAVRQARVLIVDDNTDAALTLREFLSGLGHQTAVAHDGIAALDLATSFLPTVALVDIGLPLMDGYEFARRLRKRFGADRLMLVAVTGYGQDEDRARALAAGFDYHLVKPIELGALPKLLERSAAETAGAS
jgi:PAS domain S-box-containing protein